MAFMHYESRESSRGKFIIYRKDCKASYTLYSEFPQFSRVSITLSESVLLQHTATYCNIKHVGSHAYQEKEYERLSFSMVVGIVATHSIIMCTSYVPRDTIIVSRHGIM